MWDTTRLRDAVSYLNFRQGSSDKILLFFPIFVYTSAFLDSTVSLSEGVILQLRRIRRSLDVDSVATLVHAFDASRVDYCGSLLIGAPRKTTDKLQHVLNSAARIVSNTRKFDRGLTHCDPPVAVNSSFLASVAAFSALVLSPLRAQQFGILCLTVCVIQLLGLISFDVT